MGDESDGTVEGCDGACLSVMSKYGRRASVGYSAVGE